MNYLNLDPNYFTHLKTRKLIARLGRGAELMPLKLWCYTATHYAIDGRLVGHSASDIESLIEWEGAPGKAVRVLTARDLKLIEKDESGTYVVHGWLKHNGHLRASVLRAKKAANARWGNEPSNKETDAQVMLEHAQASPSNALTQPNPPNPLDSLTQPTGPGMRRDGPGGNGAHGNGSGRAAGVGVGNLGSSLAQTSPDFERQVKVQSLLSSVDMNAETQREFYQRRDISPATVERHIREIKKDAKVDDVAGVLAHRLRSGRQSP